MTTSTDLRHGSRPDLASFVAEIISHDNASTITLSPRTIEALNVTSSDVVLVENQSQRRAIPLIVRTGDSTQNDQVVGLNRMAGTNVRVQNKDRVTISRLSTLGSAARITVSPIDTSFEGRCESLRETCLKSYFHGQSRPLGVGDHFTATHGNGDLVDFCVISIDPAPYCRVSDETIIHTDGKPISRMEAAAWYTKASGSDKTPSHNVSGPKLRPQLLLTSQETPQNNSSGNLHQPTTPPHDIQSNQTNMQGSRIGPAAPPSPVSPALPPLQTVQTLPSIEHTYTSSSTSSDCQNGLWQTQSQIVVRDFAPNIVVDKKRRKNPYRKITFRSMFLPHTVDPSYHMDLL